MRPTRPALISFPPSETLCLHEAQLCVTEAHVAVNATMPIGLQRECFLSAEERGPNSSERDAQTMITVDISAVLIVSPVPLTSSQLSLA